MCLGDIARLADVWDDGDVRLGRLEDGCVVPLSFVPEARLGAYLLLHLGIPVEVLTPNVAHQALHLRAEGASDLERDST